MEEHIAYRRGIPLTAAGLEINIGKSSSSEIRLWISGKNYKLHGISLLKEKKPI